MEPETHSTLTLPQPDAGHVDRLIADAERHPLGIDFLHEGDLGVVAVMFGVHAFTVEAARERLSAGRLAG